MEFTLSRVYGHLLQRGTCYRWSATSIDSIVSAVKAEFTLTDSPLPISFLTLRCEGVQSETRKISERDERAR